MASSFATSREVITVMKISTTGRHLREGFRSMVRNGWMTFASLSSIGISLFILGVFVLLTTNVNYIAEHVESQVEIRVYLSLEIDEQSEINRVQNQIGMMPEVHKITFIHKDEGLKILEKTLGEDWVEGFQGDANPLPHSFTVEVKNPEEIATVARNIEALNDIMQPAPIDDVEYGEGTVEDLFAFSNLVNRVGFVLVVGLAITALFLIANTIRLTIMARRREIAIMKLVGATNGFIRWPFFIEGACIGLIGAAIPLGVLLYGYHRLIESSKSRLSFMSMIQLKPLDEVAIPLIGLLMGLGVAIGVLGTLMSVRKHLKV